MKHFRREIFIFLIAMSLNVSLFACKCIPIDRDSCVIQGLRYSDIAFLGELLTADTINHAYSFKLIEVFKGSFKDSIIKGRMINSCSLFPYQEGLWIVYANLQNDSLIDISSCSPTVSLRRTEGLIPPPPVFISEKVDKEYLQWKISVLEKRLDGLSDWFYNLDKLRNYKKNNQMEISHKPFEYKIFLIIFSLILNVLMFIWIIRKK
jgi:hypothetical protein